MELSTGVLNIVKSLADLPNDSYSKLIASVFETFLINTKTGGFDLNLDIKTIGRAFSLQFYCKLNTVYEYDNLSY
jgi:hypothetical protein